MRSFIENKEMQHIHFVGICGTAMASVAVMFKELGYHVTGSDANAYPPMSTFLVNQGIQIFDGYAGENVKDRPDLVVIGNVVSRGNPEVETILNEKIVYTSLPAIVRDMFLWEHVNVVVTGTHGKTTTASMLAWIFHHAGQNPSFLVGGIPENFGKGCVTGNGKYFILEGDEYDSSFFDKRAKFLHYLPDIAIITNIEFDHADIYENVGEILKAFRYLGRTIPASGHLVVNADDKNATEVSADCFTKRVTVGEDHNADYRITDIRNTQHGMSFSIMCENGVPLMEEIFTPLCGEHNVRNAAMGIVVSHLCGLRTSDIFEGMASFKGVKRRLELVKKQEGLLIYNDFAHHPTEVRQTLRAIKEKHPQACVWAVFEPRSNTSRRKVFEDVYPESLAEADGAIITDVYKKNALPKDETLDVEYIVHVLRTQYHTSAYHVHDENEVISVLKKNMLKNSRNMVIVMMTNGGFMQDSLPDLPL